VAIGKNRFSSQRELRQDIQHAFQKPRISSLENRGRKNDSARLFHSSERFRDLGLRGVSSEQRFCRKVSHRKEPSFKIFGSQ
jgi:hypothetical protein